MADANLAKVLECLNTARGMEMVAIHQYMLQKYLIWNYDYGSLASNMQRIAIDEMKHARRFASRIDDLGGDVNCQMNGAIEQKQSIEEIYPFDVGLETNTIEQYSKFAKICGEAGDSTTAGLFGSIIKEEEVHLAYYKETAGHIKKLGAAFLAKFAGESKDMGGIHSFIKLQMKENL